MARGSRQTLLLTSIDRLGGRSEAVRASVSDLDEDQGRAVAHHQVDLAEAATVIARDGLQTPAFQIVLGEPLLGVADTSGSGCLIGGPGGRATLVAAQRVSAVGVSEGSPASRTPVSPKRPSASWRWMRPSASIERPPVCPG